MVTYIIMNLSREIYKLKLFLRNEILMYSVIDIASFEFQTITDIVDSKW